MGIKEKVTERRKQGRRLEEIFVEIDALFQEILDGTKDADRMVVTWTIFDGLESLATLKKSYNREADGG